MGKPFMKIRFEAKVSKSLSLVKNAFNHELFLSLKPPIMQLKLLRFDGCKPGDEVHLKMGAFGITQNWISVITSAKETEQEWQFIDEGKVIPWPLLKWKHVHSVIALSANESLIIDDIEYEGVNPLMTALLYPSLWFSFSVRPRIYRKYFKTGV